MYPETDVVSIVVSPERIERLRANLPEMPLARQVISSDHTQLFEGLVREGEVDPTLLAVTLTETLKMIEREGVETGRLSDEALRGVFSLVGSGRTAKESIPEILAWLGSNPEGTPEDALSQLGLAMLTHEELRSLVEAKVAERRELVERMGARAVGPLMGAVMAEVRGRAEARDVQALLREILATLPED
jgi:glutamyl-tRNA(Gln) amidotransferase subunit E